MIGESLAKIANKLQRQAVTSASRWACKYRYIDGKLWNFDRHPWLKEIHDCQDQLIACQKSAQMGVTETAMNRTFYKIDVEKQSILYLLPTTKPDAYDFSNTRFDPALEESEHLAQLFSETRNIGVKRSGSQILYIRGAGSSSGLRSIPVAHIMFDEINEMEDTKVRMAFERTSGQFGDTSFFMLSTPTIPDKGVSLYYKDSSQDHFMFPCPHCGRLTELTLDCLQVTAEVPEDPAVMNSFLECKECHIELKHEDKINFLGKGTWEKTFTNKNNRGFYINQLYSMAIHPNKIAKYYLETQMDSDFEQEFWNSKMGMPFTQEGSSIEDADVTKCINTSFKKTQDRDEYKIVTMGVDIGKRCHYVITEWTTSNTDPKEIIKNSHKKVLNEGTVDNLQNIDIILDNYDIDYCVVDALPETRSCIELANRQDGRLKICYYNTSAGSRDIVVERDTHKITVNRTLWLDITLSRIRKGVVELPVDTSEEFKKHMTSMHRSIRKDKFGNPKPFWEATRADHFVHASLYAEVALKMYVSTRGENCNLEDLF